jgi:phosphoglucosamine mutase
MSLPNVQAQVRRAEEALAGAGRVLVRYSGTEPLARVMIEGPDEATIRHWAGAIAMAIREALG